MKLTIKIRREMMKVAFHYSLSPTEAGKALDLTFTETQEYVSTLTDHRAVARHIYLALKKRIEPCEFDFNTTLTELQKDIYNFSYFLTKDREAAQDLSQSAMLKALLNKEKFRPRENPKANFKSWLLSITQNLHISEGRRIERKTRLEPLVQKDDIHYDNHSSIDTTMLIDQLPNRRMKQVVEMTKQGYRAKDISEELGVSVSVVRDDNYKARKFLKARR